VHLNLAQRIILWLGCNGLALVWLMPATYIIHADGTRLESNWQWLWDVPLDWSVSVPLTTLRLGSVVVFTIGMCFVFRTNPTQEGGK
jgi:hypothetical protein